MLDMYNTFFIFNNFLLNYLYLSNFPLQTFNQGMKIKCYWNERGCDNFITIDPQPPHKVHLAHVGVSKGDSPAHNSIPPQVHSPHEVSFYHENPFPPSQTTVLKQHQVNECNAAFHENISYFTLVGDLLQHPLNSVVRWSFHGDCGRLSAKCALFLERSKSRCVRECARARWHENTKLQACGGKRERKRKRVCTPEIAFFCCCWLYELRWLGLATGKVVGAEIGLRG